MAAPRTPGPVLTFGLLAVLCLVWGSTWLVIKQGLADMPPFTSAGLRFLLASILMALLVLILRKREGGTVPPVWLWLTTGVGNFGVGYGLVYYTETQLPSGLVSVLWAVFPLYMALLSAKFLPNESMHRRHALGFLLGFVGVVFLFVTDVQGFGRAATSAALLLLLSPLVTAVCTVVIKRYGSGCSSLLLNRNSMAVGAVCLLAYAALVESTADFHLTSTAVFSLLYLAVFGTCVTFGLYFWLMRHCRASRLSLIAFVTPCVALILGQALGDEPITGFTVSGTALILLGVALGIGGFPRTGAPAKTSRV